MTQRKFDHSLVFPRTPMGTEDLIRDDRAEIWHEILIGDDGVGRHEVLTGDMLILIADVNRRFRPPKTPGLAGYMGNVGLIRCMRYGNLHAVCASAIWHQGGHHEVSRHQRGWLRSVQSGLS